jgi:hypothetical protein
MRGGTIERPVPRFSRKPPEKVWVSEAGKSVVRFLERNMTVAQQYAPAQLHVGRVTGLSNIMRDSTFGDLFFGELIL